MKRPSKKQKIIISIAVLLIVIIITMLITTNIISNNNQITSEGYLASTANAGSNLIANYIQNGVTIGGITGTLETLDTSDATATAGDITYGKTAYVDGKKITGTRRENTLGTVTGNETTNTTVSDIYGNQVKVPAGFRVVNPEDDVTKGIIIEDVSAGDSYTRGSQFVWIPVGNVITDNSGSITRIELERHDFDDNGIPTTVSSSFKESSTSIGNGVVSGPKNLTTFLNKAESNGGYYLGRYEAGDATAITSARGSSSSDENPIVCKDGVYPYNYISQSTAASLCKEMYNSNNFESDLINGYAWDTALVFIQTFSGDNAYSTQRKITIWNCKMWRSN